MLHALAMTIAHHDLNHATLDSNQLFKDQIAGHPGQFWKIQTLRTSCVIKVCILFLLRTRLGGGAYRDRTDDIQLAKLALSQLS